MQSNLNIRFTLIADGSSDVILLTVVKWLLNELYPSTPTDGIHADFRNLRNPPKSMSEKIQRAKADYPHNLLFIHRDAETTDLNIIEQRKNEVAQHLPDDTNAVIIVPVKMMETWLLVNEDAIKKAAGNRNYNGEINLPNIKSLEKLQTPKDFLLSTLKTVSGLKGRRLDKFNEYQAVHLVAENIEDFSALRQLNAFQVLEQDIINAVAQL